MNTETVKQVKYTDQSKINCKNPNKNMTLANFSIYYIKSEYSNNKFKVSEPT